MSGQKKKINKGKQLHRTLRNKGILIYIAKKLQALGVYRDWKQCLAKYKNLKYKYRTVKYAHNSGDSSKTVKFFCDLDAILQYEPAIQLKEEEANGRCLATLSQSTAPEATEGKKVFCFYSTSCKIQDFWVRMINIDWNVKGDWNNWPVMLLCTR